MWTLSVYMCVHDIWHTFLFFLSNLLACSDTHTKSNNRQQWQLSFSIWRFKCVCACVHEHTHTVFVHVCVHQCVCVCVCVCVCLCVCNLLELFGSFGEEFVYVLLRLPMACNKVQLCSLSLSLFIHNVLQYPRTWYSYDDERKTKDWNNLESQSLSGHRARTLTCSWKPKLSTIECGHPIFGSLLGARLCAHPEISLESNFVQRSPLCILMQRDSHVKDPVVHVRVW